jgi:protein SCO1/2
MLDYPMKRTLLLTVLLLVFLTACKQKRPRLPILGKMEIVNSGGSIDTISHTIPDFAFVDQDSNLITKETLKGKVYVADFFFTTCPTICPIMKTQMLRVYEQYKGNDQVAFLSHTIDPKHDTVAVLKDYADRLGISSGQWHMVTGDREEIFEIAQTSYMVSANEDPSAPGGAVHSGAFILVDKKRRIRGYYDGTKAEEVDKLVKDIDFLLKEENKQVIAY